MRRYARTLAIIAVLAIVAGLIVGFQTINIRDFERGGDTLLGLSLGLDLQGGSHLVYQAIDADTGEPAAPDERQMDALKESIERRVNASGLGQPIIQILGENRLLIQLPGIRDLARAKDFIGETAQLVFRHRTLEAERVIDELTEDDIVGVELGLFSVEAPEGMEDAPETGGSASGDEPQADETPIAESTPETSGESGEGEPSEEEAEAEAEVEDGLPGLFVEFTDDGAAKFGEIVDRLRVSLGLDEEGNPVEGDYIPFPSRLSVSVKGAQTLDFELAYALLAGPLGLQLDIDPRTPISAPFIERIDESNVFVLNIGNIAQTLTEARETFGDEVTVSFPREIQGKLDEDIGLTGENLTSAYADQHQGSGQPIVVVEFDVDGTRVFGELTEQIAGLSDHQVAIFLDENELISPEVTTAITAGSAIIQGRDFTLERVQDLALLLESGRLPTPIELIAERDVDAILGADSLSKSVVAGLVGLALVLLFMVLYYRMPGVIAAVSLAFYALLILAIFKILPITMTLSGVGAVILSIGMAVDANILIFERMKDELRLGRTLMAAINIGFNRAWPAIRDGNVSTLITCAILFYFSDQLGTTVVQGFASALAIGVVLSMFTAIFVSRTILRVVANTRLSRRPGWFVPSGGADLPQQHTAPLVQRS